MVKVIQKVPSTTLGASDTSTPLGTIKELYQCEECGFHYENREWAEKCEAWCRGTKAAILKLLLTPRRINRANNTPTYWSL